MLNKKETTIEEHLKWHKEYEKIKKEDELKEGERNIRESQKVDEIKKDMKTLFELHKKISRDVRTIRQKIIEDTLQLISIIIGLFALVIGIFVLLIKDNLSLKNYAWILLIFLGYFCGLTTVWFYYWQKINKGKFSG